MKDDIDSGSAAQDWQRALSSDLPPKELEEARENLKKKLLSESGMRSAELIALARQVRKLLNEIGEPLEPNSDVISDLKIAQSVLTGILSDNEKRKK